MSRHWVHLAKGGRAEMVVFGHRCKSSSYRVLLDISHTTQKLFFGRDLAFVETALPHVVLALQAEGEATLDELHRFFKRYISGGRDERMKMVRHDHDGMQEELSLTAIVEDCLLKQFGCCGDLKKAAALRGHGGYEIRPGFLRCESHLRSINERPVAKATSFARLYSGA